MAQGKTKVKAKLPQGVKQKQKHKKPLGLKRGKTFIAPKKAKVQEAAASYKRMERAINKRNEHEVTMKASNMEAKSLQIIRSQDAIAEKK